jgi:hypothetical protein
LAFDFGGVVDASVIWLLSTLVGATVVEDTRAEVALIADDDRVSAEVFAPVDGGKMFVKLETGEAVIGIETGFARSHTRLANLVDLVSELNR